MTCLLPYFPIPSSTGESTQLHADLIPLLGDELQATGQIKPFCDGIVRALLPPILTLDINTPSFAALAPLLMLVKSKPIAAGLAFTEAFLPSYLTPGASPMFQASVTGKLLESNTLLGAMLRVSAMVSN